MVSRQFDIGARIWIIENLNLVGSKGGYDEVLKGQAVAGHSTRTGRERAGTQGETVIGGN